MMTTNLLLTHSTRKSIFLNSSNPEEIIEITNKLKSSNISGMDNIGSKLIKTIVNEIAIILSHIINMSLTTGIVPY